VKIRVANLAPNSENWLRLQFLVQYSVRELFHTFHCVNQRGMQRRNCELERMLDETDHKMRF